MHTHSYVWHDSFSRRSRSPSWSRTFTDICSHIHAIVHESRHAFMCVIWLILQMTQVWKLITNSHRYMHTYSHMYLWVMSHIHVWDMTHSPDDQGLKVDHEPTQVYAFTYTHTFMSHLTNSYAWHDSFFPRKKSRSSDLRFVHELTQFPTNMKNETNIYAKRDLHARKKRPTHMQKATCTY